MNRNKISKRVKSKEVKKSGRISTLYLINFALDTLTSGNYKVIRVQNSGIIKGINNNSLHSKVKKESKIVKKLSKCKK